MPGAIRPLPMDQQCQRHQVKVRAVAPKAPPHERVPKLGEILVAQGEITADQLGVALERQKTSGRRLGEELIKAGFVHRSVVSRAIRIQRRMAFGARHSGGRDDSTPR